MRVGTRGFAAVLLICGVALVASIAWSSLSRDAVASAAFHGTPDAAARRSLAAESTAPAPRTDIHVGSIHTNETAMFVPLVDWTRWMALISSTFSSFSNGRILIAGGTQSDGEPNANSAVHWSDDGGFHWSGVTAPWHGRMQHGAAVLENSTTLVVIGGYTAARGASYLSDVWASFDAGAKWQLQAATTPMGTKVVGNSLVAVGSELLYHTTGSVFSSEDVGRNWTRVCEDAPWAPNGLFSAVSIPGTQIVLVMGGENERNDELYESSDVCRSVNAGRNWTLVTSSPGWTPRYDFSAVVAGSGPNASVIVAGGTSTYEHPALGDIWISNDAGDTWRVLTRTVNFGARRDMNFAVHSTTRDLLMIGGNNVQDIPGTVWSTLKCGDGNGRIAQQGNPYDGFNSIFSCGPCKAGKYNPTPSAFAEPPKYDGWRAACHSCPTRYFCAGSGVSTPTLCPVGRYGATPGMSTSACSGPCAAGRYGNFSGAANASCAGECPVSTYCVAGSVEPLPCPAGTFGNAAGLTSAACSGKCTAGYWCPAASTTPKAHACTPGTTCPAGAGAPTTCPSGTWGGKPLESRPTCSGYCPRGRYGSSTGLTTVNCTGLCPAGRWGGAAGLKTPGCSGPCNKGSFCVAGTLDATGQLCAAGRYGATTGLGTSACSGPCKPGYYGTTPGTINATCSGICAIGTYCEAGTTNPDGKPCPAGKYGATQGLGTSDCSGNCSAAYLCPPHSTSATQQVCGPGFYCPAGTPAMMACPVGHYCPVGSVSPIPCAAGRYGAIERLTSISCSGDCDAGCLCRAASTSPRGVPCPVAHYCSSGATTPTPCPAGVFGNSTGSATPQCSGTCPAGYYCGETTNEPTPCPQGWWCAAGAGLPSECPPGMTTPLSRATSRAACVQDMPDVPLSTVIVALAVIIIIWLLLHGASVCDTRRAQRKFVAAKRAEAAASGLAFVKPKQTALDALSRDYKELLAATGNIFHTLADLYYMEQHLSHGFSLHQSGSGFVVGFSTATVISLCVSTAISGMLVWREAREHAPFRAWMRDHVVVASIVVVLGGTKVGALYLLTCRAFGASVFSSPMRRRTLDKVRVATSWMSVVEDVPQIFCSVALALQHGTLQRLDVLASVLSSGAALVLQLLVGLFTSMLFLSKGDEKDGAASSEDKLAPLLDVADAEAAAGGSTLAMTGASAPPRSPVSMDPPPT